MSMLETHKDKQHNAFDLDPHYPPEITRRPYPLRYQVSTFRKFDGSGSAREHLMSFVDNLRVHRENRELRLKEFSKSLMGSAFTWCIKLCPRSIHTWEELATKFCNKFLEEEGVTHIMDLGKVKQRNNERLIAFIRRYRDKALYCKETLLEADLVYGCIQNIEGKSQLFLSIGGISTFGELLKRTTNIFESLRRQGKRTREVELVYEVNVTEGRSREKGSHYDSSTGGTDMTIAQEGWSIEGTKRNIEILIENLRRAMSRAWKNYPKCHCWEMSWTSWRMISSTKDY